MSASTDTLKQELDATIANPLKQIQILSKLIDDLENQVLNSGGSVPDGGTTGQVLAKLSNTDGDAAWTNGTPGPAGSGSYVVEDESASPGTESNPRLLSNLTIATSGEQRQLLFVEGNSGPITITATPRIQNGTTVGQELLLIGTSDSNAVTFAGSGGNLRLNGPVTLRQGASLKLVWGGSNWTEESRNDK